MVLGRFSLKVENLQRMYELINVFATQQLLSFWLPTVYISFAIDSKSWRLEKTAQTNQLFQLLNLICK